MPATLLLVLHRAAALAGCAGARPRALALALLALVCSAPRLGARGELREALGGGLRGLGVPHALRAALWVVLVAADHPARRRVLGLARADAGRSVETTSRSTRPSRSRSSSPAAAPRTSGRPTSSSTRSSSPRRALAPPRRLDVVRDDRHVRAHVVLAIAPTSDGLPALPFLSFGFLVANADLLWQPSGAGLTSGRIRRSRQRFFFG